MIAANTQGGRFCSGRGLQYSSRQPAQGPPVTFQLALHQVLSPIGASILIVD